MRYAVLTLLLVVGSPLLAASGAGGFKQVLLPFIEDDYSRALAQARHERRPLFVDAWAPWCHTCRSMRAFVFTDPALASQAQRFVWLSIDTEKAENAPFLATHPIAVWPTLMVIDPETEQTVMRWPGSAGAQQLSKILDDGERAVRGRGDAGIRAIAAADRLSAAGKPREAADAYRAALDRVGPDKRPRVVEALVTALVVSHDDVACAKATLELTPGLTRGGSFVNALSLGLGCAKRIDDEGKKVRAGLIALGEEGLKVRDIVDDDRSALYDSLVGAYELDRNEAARKDTAARWFAFVRGEAEHAHSPEQRAVFDPHTVGAATALGEPLRAVPALEASERDFPRDYNPPARLALVYFRAGKLEDALAAANRALARIYGPRSIEVYLLKARIQDKRGDHAGAHKTMEQAASVASALPAAQRRDDMIARVKKQQVELAR
jgi:hypothetical protein